MAKNEPAGGTVADVLWGLVSRKGSSSRWRGTGDPEAQVRDADLLPRGSQALDPWPNPRSAPGNKWSPNLDHYPELDKDGGERKPWNVRLAHVYCNVMDRGLRTRIRAMLEKDPSLSFKEIAARLTRKHSIEVPPPYESWTAGLVRKVCVS